MGLLLGAERRVHSHHLTACLFQEYVTKPGAPDDTYLRLLHVIPLSKRQ